MCINIIIPTVGTVYKWRLLTVLIVESVNVLWGGGGFDAFKASLETRPHRYRWFSISFRFGREIRLFSDLNDYLTLNDGKLKLLMYRSVS